MKPNTLCIIEPPARCASTMGAQQLGGLVVVTQNEHVPGFWNVLPAAILRSDTEFIDALGRHRPAGLYRCSVNALWLRPLKGEPVPEWTVEYIEVPDGIAHG